MTSAARFDAATDRVSYSGGAGNPPNPAGGYTFAAWLLLNVDRNDWSTIQRLHSSTGGATCCVFGTPANGDTPAVFAPSGIVNSSSMVVGDWYYLAYTVAATEVDIYKFTDDGSMAAFGGTIGQGAAPTGHTLAGRSVGDPNEWLNASMAFVRMWSSVLSPEQLATEQMSAEPVETAGLWAHYPLQDSLQDTSGNARHLSAGSTAVAFAEGPPLPEILASRWQRGDGVSLVPHLLTGGGLVVLE